MCFDELIKIEDPHTITQSIKYMNIIIYFGYKQSCITLQYDTY